MPLLRNDQIVEQDPWQLLDDDAPLADNKTAIVVSLQRLLTNDTAVPIAGVKLSPADDALRLAAYVGQLQLIAIDFPAFTDGRGFSQARIIRQRLNFTGELRAVGDVRSDQIPFMRRVGFDAFLFAQAPDLQSLQRELTRYQTAYQPSYPLPVTG